MNVYPDCPTICRTVDVGGWTKPELLEELHTNAISMNEAGERLFESDQFNTSAVRYSVATVQLTVGNLGLPRGGTVAEIHGMATGLGLCLCPLELGPHLRLQHLDQSEGHLGTALRQHCAPSGSITIASQAPTEDDDDPKGFYLRRINGVLWLRGYYCDAQHVWDADDCLVFAQP